MWLQSKRLSLTDWKFSRIARRYPHQVGKEVAKGINAGRIEFADKHLSSGSSSPLNHSTDSIMSNSVPPGLDLWLLQSQKEAWRSEETTRLGNRGGDGDHRRWEHRPRYVFLLPWGLLRVGF